MTDPIFDPKFWRMRLHSAPSTHQILCICSKEFWNNATERHCKILAETVKPNDSVLDIGCAYGRLLDLMPTDWTGNYLGIDLSPDFIDLAQINYPTKKFWHGDIRNFYIQENECLYDWGVVISMRKMVVDNFNIYVWDEIEKHLKTLCKQLLILEYGDE